MIIILFSGIITGLVMALSTGPIFFTLLQLSVDKGFKKAIYFILGTSFIDTTMVLFLWFGLNKIDIQTDSTLIPLIGAAVLIAFGVSFFFKKPSNPTDETDNTPKSPLLGNSTLFFKAVLLDVFNPLVWAFWAAIVEYSISNYETNASQLTYFAGILLAILSTDMLKSHYAQKLKSVLSDKYLSYMNYGIGLLLIGFGLKLLYDAFFV